jgi:lipopolysaccharide heptosyltransferase I
MNIPLQRILVVKTSSVGDLLHALPAVAAVGEATGASIDWVANRGYADLVACFEPVNRVIPFPRHDLRRNLRPFLADLRRETYDLVLDAQGLMKSALIARAARSDRVLGPSFHREGSRLLYHAVTGSRNKDRHAVEENLDVLAALGIPRGNVRFPVRWPEPDLPSASGPRIGVIPRSRWTTKNWPVASFAAACEGLAEQAGASLFLFGASEDRAVCEDLAARLGGAADNRCGATTLPELGGWLKAMDLVLCVDTGPMHIAAAAGTPVLAVFGATDPRRTGPYGAAHRVLVRDDLPCRPCLSRTCRLPERDTRCLTGLDPARVVAAALAMLEQAAS